jgi:hypothetical protein
MGFHLTTHTSIFIEGFKPVFDSRRIIFSEFWQNIQ